jgi:hypothetical protein
MADLNLIKYRLGDLGYTFFDVGDKVIIDSLIIEILKSGEKRYMKAIPFLMYQSHAEKDRRPHIDFRRLYLAAKENGVETEVNAILYVTREIFKATGDREDMIKAIISYLKKYSSEKEGRMFEILFGNKAGTAGIEFESERYARNPKINWIDLGEFSSDFMMQKSLKEASERRTLKERMEISKSRDMLVYLSELFSPRQSEIIQRIIDDKPLDKTEYEYYIRVMKKRLEAIAELKDLAETTVKKRPKRTSHPL